MRILYNFKYLLSLPETSLIQKLLILIFSNAYLTKNIQNIAKIFQDNLLSYIL